MPHNLGVVPAMFDPIKGYAIGKELQPGMLDPYEWTWTGGYKGRSRMRGLHNKKIIEKYGKYDSSSYYHQGEIRHHERSFEDERPWGQEDMKDVDGYFHRGNWWRRNFGDTADRKWNFAKDEQWMGKKITFRDNRWWSKKGKWMYDTQELGHDFFKGTMSGHFTTFAESGIETFMDNFADDHHWTPTEKNLEHYGLQVGFALRDYGPAVIKYGPRAINSILKYGGKAFNYFNKSEEIEEQVNMFENLGLEGVGEGIEMGEIATEGVEGGAIAAAALEGAAEFSWLGPLGMLFGSLVMGVGASELGYYIANILQNQSEYGIGATIKGTGFDGEFSPAEWAQYLGYLATEGAEGKPLPHHSDPSGQTYIIPDMPTGTKESSYILNKAGAHRDWLAAQASYKDDKERDGALKKYDMQYRPDISSERLAVYSHQMKGSLIPGKDKQGNVLMIAIRGSDFSKISDWAADFGKHGIIAGNLYKNKEYIDMREDIKKIIDNWKPLFDQYDGDAKPMIYLSGHSLGGTMIMELLKDPDFKKYADEITSASAFEPGLSPFQKFKDGELPDKLNIHVNEMDIASLFRDPKIGGAWWYHDLRPDEVLDILSLHSPIEYASEKYWNDYNPDTVDWSWFGWHPLRYEGKIITPDLKGFWQENVTVEMMNKYFEDRDIHFYEQYEEFIKNLSDKKRKQILAGDPDTPENFKRDLAKFRHRETEPPWGEFRKSRYQFAEWLNQPLVRAVFYNEHDRSYWVSWWNSLEEKEAYIEESIEKNRKEFEKYHPSAQDVKNIRHEKAIGNTAYWKNYWEELYAPPNVQSDPSGGGGSQPDPPADQQSVPPVDQQPDPSVGDSSDVVSGGPSDVVAGGDDGGDDGDGGDI